jgi:hypothetical protein
MAVARIRDGWVAEGGPRRELLTGRTATELFPRLLPLLDGTRSIAEIAGVLRIPAVPLQRVVEVLRQRGLLHLLHTPTEDGQTAGSPMSTFLRRSVPDGRGDAMERRLRAAQTRVIGTGLLAALIADLLDRSGVTVVEPRPGPASGARESATTLVISVAEPGAASGAPASPSESAWLPLDRTRDGVLLGPLLHVAGAVCPPCRWADIGDGWPAGWADPADEAALAGIAAGVAAGVALRYLAGYRTPSRAGETLLVVGPAGPPREHVVVRRPDCPACGHRGPALTEPGLATLGEERRAGTPPGGWDLDRLEPTAPSRYILAKPYLTEPRLAVRGPSDERDGVAALAWLLARGVGAVRPRRGGLPSAARWAPSAARAGSTHAYVLGNLAWDGSAVHYFDGGSHELVRLRAAGDLEAGPPLVVLTGEVSVLRSEFGSASRRVAYQDAGLAVAHLHACAEFARWRARARPAATDNLATMLELDPEREVVAAVLDVDPGSPGAALTVPVGAQRVPRWLRRAPMTYRFAERPVSMGVVMELVNACLSGVAEHWKRVPGPDVSCVLYARRVGELPPGLRLATAGSTPALVTSAGADLAPIEAFLRDRGCSPAALLLFTGHVPDALAGFGEAGYPALVVKAAAASGLARLAAGRAGLGSGLFARAPGGLVSAALGDRADRHRLLHGCAIGHPDPDGSGARGERVAW